MAANSNSRGRESRRDRNKLRIEVGSVTIAGAASTSLFWHRFNATKTRALGGLKLFRANRIVIEDKASGTQLIQDLKHDGVFGIEPFEPLPHCDKIVRLHAQTAEFERGGVLLPRFAPWLGVNCGSSLSAGRKRCLEACE
jgi:hypothetical protein